MGFDASWMEAVMLAAVRVTAFLVVAPPFSYNGIPARIKAMLAIGLAIAMAPRITTGYVPLETGPFIWALLMQLLIGFFLGFLVMLTFAAVQSAGNLVDLFGGFQMAQAFDPQAMLNGAQFTRFFHLAALALLFATDGYQMILAGLMRTFEVLPVTASIDGVITVEALAGGLTQMFLAALQIAGPLIVILFLADVGLGLLTRVAPALNAFALGFPLKILLTVSFASIIFLALPQVVSALTADALDAMFGGG
jgi:flagellar biosynthetic protein FliR